VGVLRNDENQFHHYQTVYETIKQTTADNLFKYPSTSGGDDFEKNILKWLFPRNLLLDNVQKKVIATSGATGAIYISLKAFAKAGDCVLVPNLCWSNYKTICSSLSLEMIEYGKHV